MTDAPVRTISFEFFPPQSTDATLRLWRAVERLAPLAPSYVSVTYGAGGTTRDRTRAAIRTIQDRARLPVAGHLTCVNATGDETIEVARSYRKMGVQKIVALRGDPPKGAGGFQAHPDGFASAAELVGALAADGWQDIAVAAYPEVHPEASSAQADIDMLKRKVDAGATSALTQFFFETDDFLRFRDRCADAGITIPVHPGILPVENFANLTRFAARCGANIPDWMSKAFGAAEDMESHRLLATAIATETCDSLLSQGVEHLHFYTLNMPDLTYDIVRTLGFEPARFGMATGAGAA